MNKLGFLLVVVVSVSLALAAQPPCVCTRNIDQVCGSDGKTYDNECILQCENYKHNTQITVEKHAPCEVQTEYDPCTTCTMDYRPVCGSDGKDYSHKCVFECAKKTQPELTFTEGPCEKKKLCQVTLEYKPVCGSDGKEYPNRSAVECEKESQPELTYTDGPCKKN